MSIYTISLVCIAAGCIIIGVSIIKARITVFRCYKKVQGMRAEMEKLKTRMSKAKTQLAKEVDKLKSRREFSKGDSA